MEIASLDFTCGKCYAFIIPYQNPLSVKRLLPYCSNIEKKALDFDKWLSTKVSAGELAGYKKKYYVPDVDLAFKNFGLFLANRRKILLGKAQS